MLSISLKCTQLAFVASRRFASTTLVASTNGPPWPLEADAARSSLRELAHHFVSASKSHPYEIIGSTICFSERNVQQTRDSFREFFSFYSQAVPAFFGFQQELAIARIGAARSYEELHPELLHNSLCSPTHFSVAMHTVLHLEDARQQETVFYIFGRALRCGAVEEYPQLWADLFTACRKLQVPGALFTKWFTLMMEKCGQAPVEALHEALGWCEYVKDVEKVLEVWSVIRRQCGNGKHLLTSYGKVLRALRDVKMDGGAKQQIVKDINTNFSLQELAVLPWETLCELGWGISERSLISLFKIRSGDGSARHSPRDIPFNSWLFLLHLLCRRQRISEAESLFSFVCEKIVTSDAEKDAVVIQLMSLYARLPIPDFESCNAVFTQHVLQTPNNQPKVRPNVYHYQCLLRASDSTETSNMLFFEACANGISLSERAYRYLFRRGSAPLWSLSSQVPEFPASQFDIFLRIPSDVDAHLRREEAQTQRTSFGKLPVDSTGGSS